MLHRRKEDETLVNKLFDHRYLVETTKVCLSLLQDVPEIEDLFVTPTPAVGSYKTANGVFRNETCSNEQGILEMLMGVSRKTIGEGYQAFVNVNPIERTNLSTASLAELIYRKGSVTLLNPADAVVIHSDVSRYLLMLTDKQLYEPHFNPPPIEDINAFQVLQSLIEQLASQYTGMGVGETAMAKLLQLTSGTATGLVMKEKFTLDGAAVPVKFGGLYSDSPYTFTRS